MRNAGARIAPDTSYNFAFTGPAAKWLAVTHCGEIGANIPVVRDFRYLGAHINTTAVRKAATIDERITKAISVLKRLKWMKMRVEDKAKIIRVRIYPAALYGVEAAQPARHLIAELAAAVKAVIHPAAAPPSSLHQTFHCKF